MIGTYIAIELNGFSDLAIGIFKLCATLCYVSFEDSHSIKNQG